MGHLTFTIHRHFTQRDMLDAYYIIILVGASATEDDEDGIVYVKSMF